MSTDPTLFAAECSVWTASNLISSTTLSYTCGSTPMLGGYNVLGTSSSQLNDYFLRTFTNLPDHAFIRFTFTMYALDSWDQVSGGWNDAFSLYADTTLLVTKNLYYGNFGSTNTCGGTWADMLNYRWFGIILHSSATLAFKLVSLCDGLSNDESFGIRNVNFLFDNNDNLVTANNLCSVAPVSTYTTCSCAEGSYLAGTCTTCDVSCLSCFTAGAKGCYQCAAGYFWSGSACLKCATGCAVCFGTSLTQCLQCTGSYFYIAWNNECAQFCPYPMVISTDPVNSQYVCTSPCSSSQYIYFDGTCQNSCPAPLVVEASHNAVKLCVTACSPVEYLYWDGSCLHDCGYPLTRSMTTNFRYCTFGCDSKSFLYWNGSCIANCNPPFIQRQQNGRYFCNQPCGLSQYLYWDNTCQNTCTFPLTPSLTPMSTCSYPCASTEYLYWNGSCLTTCTFPLAKRTSRGYQFCDYPTDPSSYLYWDGSSSTTCAIPLSQRIEGSDPSYVRMYCDFPCTISQFMYWNNTCQLECDPPLTISIINNRQYCNYPCSTATIQYLYWNSSCLTTCPTPLITRSEDIYNFCDYPTDVDNFLYWDGTSASTCNSPLSQRIEGTTIIRKFCDFPCTNTLQFLYWNGSCLNNCPSPLVSGLKSGKKYCYLSTNFLYYNGSLLPNCNPPYVQSASGAQNYCSHPCGTSTSYFYYPNNTCASTCPAPWHKQVIGSIKWCIYPCLMNQYLYADGSCHDICDPLFTPSVVNGYKYCTDTCASTSFLYWNGSCRASCPVPFRSVASSSLTITPRRACLLPCDGVSEFYNVHTGKCTLECDTASQVHNKVYLECLSGDSGSEAAIEALAMSNSAGTIIDIFLQASMESESWSFVAPVNIISYIRYIDISMPKRLQLFTLTKAKPVFSIKYGRQMSDDARAMFTKRPIPTVFDNRNLHSNFLVNIWEDITSLIVMLLILLFLRVIQEILRIVYLTSLSLIVQKVSIIVRWNTCLMILAISFNDVILFASLEFRSFHAGDTYAPFGMFLCLLSIFIITTLIGGIILLIRRFQAIRRKITLYQDDQDLQPFLARWQWCQVFFTGYKNSRTPNQWFYLIYMLRIAVPGFIAAYIYASPTAQSVLCIFINGFMLGYIIWRKPINRRINYIQLIIVETFSLVINILIAALTVGTLKNELSYNKRVFIGDAIIFMNAGINLTIVIFVAVKLWKAVKKIQAFQKDQSVKERDKIIWGQLVMIVAQQGGFGFEEMYVSPLAATVLGEDEERLVEDGHGKSQVEGEGLLKQRHGTIFRDKSEESNSITPEKSPLFKGVSSPTVNSVKNAESDDNHSEVGSKPQKNFISMNTFLKRKTQIQN